MDYIIQMMSNHQYKITESEYKTIIAGVGSIFIPRLGVMVNKSSIAHAYPENMQNDSKEKNQQTGILHDGSRVKKYFGEWVDADNTVVDDNGKYTPVKIDKNYYPEIATDCVATEEEWVKIKADGLDYYEIVGMQNKTPRLENKEFQQLGKIIKN